jgi:CTP:molybdopterin cytidylyltransferase MocA
MPSIAIVPAAGKGNRFGGDKLLADVGGMPLLDRTLMCLLDGGVDQIVVVLPPAGRFETVRQLADPRVLIVVNPDPSRGMFSSIQAGVEAGGGDPILILPGDMPFVSSGTVLAVLAAQARTGGLVVPRHDGRHGHPIALPGRLRAEILRADATDRLNRVVQAAALDRLELDVDDAGVVRDVDVVGDLS